MGKALVFAPNRHNANSSRIAILELIAPAESIATKTTGVMRPHDGGHQPHPGRTTKIPDRQETWMNANAQTTLIDGLAFPEAPRWHDGALWFSDFYTQQVHRLDQDGKPTVVTQVPGQPSGLGWLPDGRLLIVSMTDRRLLRQDGTHLTTLAELGGLASFHCNDMVVDRYGRAYIGNFGFDMFAKAPVQPAELILVTPDGNARVVARDLLFPNGCVITPDQATLIVAETFGRRLTAFDIAADGSLANRRVWAALPEASPDGICIDAEGAVWVASPPTSEFLRVREGGEITDRIPTRNQAIACALGGVDRRILYMVTGRVSRRERALAERAGCIEAVRVTVPAP
jgi:sugar lactone lactonase YvrE